MSCARRIYVLLLTMVEILFTTDAFCLPGQEVDINATSGVRTCRDCPSGKYSKRGKKCFLCSVCHQGQSLVRECTRNHNTVCHCAPGTFLKDSAICRRCSTCASGSYQILDCSHNMDRRCRKCPDGLTTNSTNAKRCIAQPRIETKQNVVIHHIVDWWAFLIIPVFLLLVGCAAGVYYWHVCREKHNNKTPTATAEFYDDDSCPGQVLFVPDEMEAFQTTENLRKVRDLPAHLYDEMGMKLNNAHRRNWKYLAGMLGMSREDIIYLELEPREATQNLLHDWSTREEATVYNLHNVLVNMGRGDAACVVEQYIYR